MPGSARNEGNIILPNSYKNALKKASNPNHSKANGSKSKSASRKKGLVKKIANFFSRKRK